MTKKNSFSLMTKTKMLVNATATHVSLVSSFSFLVTHLAGNAHIFFGRTFLFCATLIFVFQLLSRSGTNPRLSRCSPIISEWNPGCQVRGQWKRTSSNKISSTTKTNRISRYVFLPFLSLLRCDDDDDDHPASRKPKQSSKQTLPCRIFPQHLWHREFATNSSLGTTNPALNKWLIS